MDKLKDYGNFLNENFGDDDVDDEMGLVLLSIDGQSPTTWYYVTDAIGNGLLDEYLNLNDEILDLLSDELYDGVMFAEDVSSLIEEDFQDELDKLFTFLLDHDIIDHKPSVSISGYEEDNEDEEVELYYDPD
jgi:hypothetical protein